MKTVHTAVTAAHHAGTAGHYSPAVRVSLGPAGDLLFISGQVAKDEAGRPTAVGDAGAQTRIVFDLIEDLLHEAGGDIGHLVNLVIHVVDMTQFAQISAVRNRRLKDPPPASTIVEVSGLANPEFLVEITATAFLPSLPEQSANQVEQR
jgi:enamine deaminase RidA (YjgF/YER057c/UK114 family)